MKASHLHRSRGQTLVEFALTLPILIFFIVGAFDLARVVFIYASMQNAVREGARYAIIPKGSASGNLIFFTKAEVMNIVAQRAFGADTVLVTVTPNPMDPFTGGIFQETETIRVDASFDFTPALPFIGNFTLRARSTMRTEW